MVPKKTKTISNLFLFSWFSRPYGTDKNKNKNVGTGYDSISQHFCNSKMLRKSCNIFAIVENEVPSSPSYSTISPRSVTSSASSNLELRRKLVKSMPFVLLLNEDLRSDLTASSQQRQPSNNHPHQLLYN